VSEDPKRPAETPRPVPKPPLDERLLFQVGKGAKPYERSEFPATSTKDAPPKR